MPPEVRQADRRPFVLLAAEEGAHERETSFRRYLAEDNQREVIHALRGVILQASPLHTLVPVTRGFYGWRLLHELAAEYNIRVTPPRQFRGGVYLLDLPAELRPRRPPSPRRLPPPGRLRRAHSPIPIVPRIHDPPPPYGPPLFLPHDDQWHELAQLPARVRVQPNSPPQIFFPDQEGGFEEGQDRIPRREPPEAQESVHRQEGRGRPEGREPRQLPQGWLRRVPRRPSLPPPLTDRETSH